MVLESVLELVLEFTMKSIHIIAVVRLFVRKSVCEPFLEKCNNSKIVTIFKL